MLLIHQAFESCARLWLGILFLVFMSPAIYAQGLPFGLAQSFVELEPLRLDSTQQQWLATQGVLRVGIVMGDYEPVDITSDTNHYQGLSADYLSIVRDRLAVPVDVKGYGTRAQAVAELLAGNIDILTSAGGYEEGVEGIVFSRHYLADQSVIVGRASNVAPVNSWAGKKIGFVDGYVNVHTADALYPDSEIIMTPNLASAVEALAEGDIEMFIANELAVQSLKSFRPYSGLRIIGDSALPTGGIAFATRLSNPELVTLINRALDSIDATTSRMILSRWTTGLAGSIRQQDINLLPGEREWIKRNPVVSLATQQFPLYAFRTGDGLWAGLSVDILARISRMTGLQFVYKETFSTAQTLDMLKNGEAHMNSSLSRSRERKAFLNFTHSYGGAPWVFVVRVNDSRLGSLDQLAGKVLVLPARHALEDLIRREYPAITLRLVDTYAQARHAVAKGEADATIQTETQAHLYPPGRLKVGRSVDGQWSAASFSVPLQYPELFSIINKTLEAMPMAEIRALRTKWLGSVGKPLVIESGLYHSAWSYSAIAALIGAGLVLLLYNRFLRRQLDAGRQFEKALQQRLALNRHFLNGIPSPIFVVGLGGELITCNQSYEERLSVQLERICGLKVTEANLFSKELAEQFQSEIMHMIQSRKPYYKKRWVKFKSGSLEIYQWTVPFYSVSGQLEGLVGGWFDAYETKKLSL